MIEGIVGTVGTGKSLCGCLRMRDAALRGRRCYSNLHPRDHKFWQWQDWEGMKEAGEGLFVVDEAHVWFNSRTFKENTSELASWQQSRKRGADLVWIAQHENRIDVAIRELTTLLWRPRIVGPLLIAVAEDPDTGERRGMRFWWKKQGFGLYHTDQVIGERSDPPRLAKVTQPGTLETPLYVERPTHVILTDKYTTRWVEYREGLRNAGILVYVDYSCVAWEVDPDDLSVLGRLYERRGEEWEVMRTVRQFRLSLKAEADALARPGFTAPGLVTRGR